MVVDGSNAHWWFSGNRNHAASFRVLWHREKHASCMTRLQSSKVDSDMKRYDSLRAPVSVNSRWTMKLVDISVKHTIRVPSISKPSWIYRLLDESGSQNDFWNQVEKVHSIPYCNSTIPFWCFVVKSCNKWVFSSGINETTSKHLCYIFSFSFEDFSDIQKVGPAAQQQLCTQCFF